MLTVSTITNEQIRTLRSEAASLGLDDVESWCDVALGHNPFHTPRNTVDAARLKLEARARCVEILNSRNGQ